MQSTKIINPVYIKATDNSCRHITTSEIIQLGIQNIISDGNRIVAVVDVDSSSTKIVIYEAEKK